MSITDVVEWYYFSIDSGKGIAGGGSFLWYICNTCIFEDSDLLHLSFLLAWK